MIHIKHQVQIILEVYSLEKYLLIVLYKQRRVIIAIPGDQSHSVKLKCLHTAFQSSHLCRWQVRSSHCRTSL